MIPCSSCGEPATLAAGDSVDAVRACATCARDDGGLGAHLGGWHALETAEEAQDLVASELEGMLARCKSSRQAPRAKERILRAPATCAACGQSLPPRTIAVELAAGAGGKWFSVKVCTTGCVPWQAGEVERADPVRVWQAFRAAVAAARRPEDVPETLWARTAPLGVAVPF